MKKLLLTLLLFGLCARAADKKISELPPVTALGATDTIEVVQAGANSKITVANAFTLAAGVTFDSSAATVLLPPFSVPFLLPSSAAPTVDALGEIAADSDFFAASKGALLWYDGTGVRVVPAYTNAVPPTDGQALVWDNTNKWWEPGSVAGGGLTIGTSAITSGTGGRLLYETAGNVVGEISGATSDGTTITLTTPALGTPSAIVLTNATGSPTGISLTAAQLNTIVSDDNPAYVGSANIFTAAQTNSTAGAASVPAGKWTGVPFAGTGTTSFPLVYINDANATASTTLNTAGTYFGVNGDGTQDLMNLLKDGTTVFRVSSVGDASAAGAITAGVSSVLGWSTSTKMLSSANGTMSICAASFGLATRLCFGNATNSAPAFGIDAVNSIKVESTTGTTTFNDASTAGSGTVANRYIFGIAAPTLTATNSSVTDTVASTVYIGGAPIASTNTTITTPYAFNVAAGVSKFGGPVVLPVYATVAALPSTAATGMVTGAQAVVQDATAPLYNTTVTGGGAVVVCVYYNGTAWISH